MQEGMAVTRPREFVGWQFGLLIWEISKSVVPDMILTLNGTVPLMAQMLERFIMTKATEHLVFLIPSILTDMPLTWLSGESIVSAAYSGKMTYFLKSRTQARVKFVFFNTCTNTIHYYFTKSTFLSSQKYLSSKLRLRNLLLYKYFMSSAINCGSSKLNDSKI